MVTICFLVDDFCWIIVHFFQPWAEQWPFHDRFTIYFVPSHFCVYQAHLAVYVFLAFEAEIS